MRGRRTSLLLAGVVGAALALAPSASPAAPMHDAASMAPLIPTVMLFVKSLRGLSHTKEEDTPEEDLQLSVQALHRLAVKTMEWAR